MTSEVFKCRYCSFTVSKWYTNKKGAKVSGWNRLERHLEDEHGKLVNLQADHEEK